MGRARFAITGAVTLVVALAGSGSAAAQVLDGGSDLSTLELQLDDDLQQTGAGDCATACRALDSMRRAAERICGIDPGLPCQKAREKVARAEQRVRAACPECAAAPHEEQEAQKAPAPAEAAPAAAPPQRGRGCAGCTTSASSDPSTGAALLGLALGVGAILRVRRRRSGVRSAETAPASIPWGSRGPSPRRTRSRPSSPRTALRAPPARPG